MFSWFFCSSEFEIPLFEDRDFEFYLVSQSPPAAPPQSLAFDNDEPVSSQHLSAMQMMFNPRSFKVNFMYWKFHQDLCRKLSD
mmetsp:Transcript_34509/g.50536  ORF Transcript_34509/g.50536 Transcript_34509/m.50536 type:complete len:83 (+) Transcript_34509:74-322(+)